MSTYARTVRSTPYRPSDETWAVIVDLLAPESSAARTELLSVAGIAAMVIASEGPKHDPIVVFGGGPQVRIRCLYDDEAISGDDANEERLASSPMGEGWSMSIPTSVEDYSWVRAALAKRSLRVSARAPGEKIEAGENAANKAAGPVGHIDPESFLSR